MGWRDRAGALALAMTTVGFCPGTALAEGSDDASLNEFEGVWICYYKPIVGMNEPVMFVVTSPIVVPKDVTTHPRTCPPP